MVAAPGGAQPWFENGTRHRSSKMGWYEENIATVNQRFFTSRAAAEEWLATVPLVGGAQP